MKLRITAADISDREELRALLIDAADELVGENHHILEPKLPWDGYPILLADSGYHPVLISFDPGQARTALLNGLQATEQLAVALPWINQVYDALRNQQLPPRLVVVSKEPPPAGALLASNPHLDLFSYRVIRVGGETGLWLERQEQMSDLDTRCGNAAIEPPKIVVSTPPQADCLPTLSEEESSYFRQL